MSATYQERRLGGSSDMTAIFPAFCEPISGADDFLGVALSRNLGRLDRLAELKRVATLSSFIDSRAMFDDYFVGELSRDGLPDVRWHAATDGLATVRALLEAVREERSGQIRDRDGLVADLGLLEALLVAARDASVGFHLLVDI